MINSNNEPLVSIIILNYNQIKVTTEFLESARELEYTNYEIILVDNNSEDNPQEFIKSNFPEVVFIRSEKNLGFTGGNNLGIESAKGDYVFVVNNDTEVTKPLLNKLIEPFNEDPEIGVVCPKIKYFESPDVIQYAGYTKINPFTGRNRAIGSKEVDNGQHNTSSYTNYAHGAAMMVKKEVIEDVGMLSDIFFIYYEELDWSCQIVKGGYKIYYQADAEIFHKESITMGKESAIKAYFHTRNRILFMRRNFSGLHLSSFYLFFILFIFPKMLLKYTLHLQKQHLKSVFRAIGWHFKSHPIHQKSLLTR